TNATYYIYDNTSPNPTLLNTVPVDQTKAPVGIGVGSAQFQKLGTYNPKSNGLIVALSANLANGTVVADAIGIYAAAATGGGPSQYETKPPYQQSVVPPSMANGQRTTPDVSFDGSVNSPV